jgi:hypothetical protein
LSLIPAKYYYDDDTKTQWNRKKQSKEEAKAARRAKFDPDSLSSALDVTEQRGKQQVVDGQDEQDEHQGDEQHEIDEHDEGEQQDDIDKQVEDEQDDLEEQVEDLEEHVKEDEVHEDMKHQETKETNKKSISVSSEPFNTIQSDDSDDNLIGFDDDGNELRMESPKPQPSELSHSTQEKRSREGVQQLRARLASKIQELREKRKAPGTSVKGAPLNREAILEARRHRQEALKAKKQLKRKREEEEEENHKQDDEQDSDDEENDAEITNGRLIFSQIMFKDGQKVSSDLSHMKEQKVKKGPRDLLGQLKHVAAKKAKIASLDNDKKQQVLEKSQWSRAILQAEGEKVRDDEKLLKKSLKLQNKRKKKSEKEWKERKDNVAKGIQARQTKREENLAKRREMKGQKGKKKQKKRAGFEGKSKSNKPKK